MGKKFLFIVISGFALFTFLEITWLMNKTVDQNIPKFVNIYNSSGESQLLNLTHFRYLRNNPAICSNVGKNKDLLLLLVHSSRKNMKSRTLIRKTMASLKTFKNWQIKTVFMIGNKNPEEIEDFVLEFNDDLVVGDFMDTYRNLSYKHMMGLKWTFEFCPNSRWILKMDDDAFVNIFKVFDIIQETEEFYPEVSYVCKPWNNITPERRPDNKYYTDLEEFPGIVYPDGCLGYAFLFKTSDAQKLLEISVTKKRFPGADDNFVTGMLREEAGLKMRLMTELFNVQNPQAPDYRSWFQGSSHLNFPIVFILLNYQHDYHDFEESMPKLWEKCVTVNFLEESSLMEIS